jgi:hypothetical protein
MSGDIKVLNIGVVCGIISILLAFCLPRQGFKMGVRLSPFLLQVFQILLLGFPCHHESPGVMIIPTGLTFIWAVFVFGLCWRFYRFPSNISRGLAIVLFVEGIAFVLFWAFLYIQSCLFYNHKLFSNPWV